MAINAEKIIGAIQCTCGGPKLVQANPNKPIGRSGATRYVSLEDNRDMILTIEQPIQSGLWLQGIRVTFADSTVFVNPRKEREICQEISDK